MKEGFMRDKIAVWVFLLFALGIGACKRSSSEHKRQNSPTEPGNDMASHPKPVKNPVKKSKKRDPKTTKEILASLTPYWRTFLTTKANLDLKNVNPLILPKQLKVIKRPPVKMVGNIVFSKQSKFQKVQVTHHDGWKHLYAQGVLQGRTPINPGTLELVDPLVKVVSRFANPKKGKTALVIGLGTGKTARELVDIGYKVVAAVAKDHFGYKGEVLVNDGFRVLKETWKSYDLIVFDAFLGDKTPSTLSSKEAFTFARHRLNKSGWVAFRGLMAPYSQSCSSVRGDLENSIGEGVWFSEIPYPVVQPVIGVHKKQDLRRDLAFHMDNPIAGLNYLPSSHSTATGVYRLWPTRSGGAYVTTTVGYIHAASKTSPPLLTLPAGSMGSIKLYLKGKLLKQISDFMEMRKKLPQEYKKVLGSYFPLEDGCQYVGVECSSSDVLGALEGSVEILEYTYPGSPGKRNPLGGYSFVFNVKKIHWMLSTEQFSYLQHTVLNPLKEKIKKANPNDVKRLTSIYNNEVKSRFGEYSLFFAFKGNEYGSHLMEYEQNSNSYIYGEEKPAFNLKHKQTVVGTEVARLNTIAKKLGARDTLVKHRALVALSEATFEINFHGEDGYSTVSLHKRTSERIKSVLQVLDEQVHTHNPFPFVKTLFRFGMEKKLVEFATLHGDKVNLYDLFNSMTRREQKNISGKFYGILFDRAKNPKLLSDICHINTERSSSWIHSMPVPPDILLITSVKKKFDSLPLSVKIWGIKMLIFGKIATLQQLISLMGEFEKRSTTEKIQIMRIISAYGPLAQKYGVRLVPLLKSNDKQVVISTILTLGSFGPWGRMYANKVERFLSHRDLHLRVSALHTLGMFHSNEESFLHDPLAECLSEMKFLDVKHRFDPVGFFKTRGSWDHGGREVEEFSRYSNWTNQCAFMDNKLPAVPKRIAVSSAFKKAFESSMKDLQHTYKIHFILRAWKDEPNSLLPMVINYFKKYGLPGPRYVSPWFQYLDGVKTIHSTYRKQIATLLSTLKNPPKSERDGNHYLIYASLKEMLKRCP
jgi:hypothetical protein